MATNYIKPFATDSSANVLTDTTLATRSELQTGFLLKSKADSALIGKLIQNATVGSYALGEFTAKHGTTDVTGTDATGFATAFETSLKSFINTEAPAPDLAPYLTKTEASTTYQPVGEYATVTQLDTKADASVLSNYATTEIVEAEFSSYDKTIKTHIESELGNYVTETAYASDKETFLTKTEASSTYATQSALANKADASALADYAALDGANFTGAVTVQSPTTANNPATKQYVDSAVSSVYKYKGSVANQAALPSSNRVVGDVYNTEDTGDNFAWDGTKWDKLAGTVDLSAYATKAEVNAKANNSEVVKLTGDQTINGSKTFEETICVNANPVTQTSVSQTISDTQEDRGDTTTTRILANLLGSDGKRLISLEASIGPTYRRAFYINGRNSIDTGWIHLAQFYEDWNGSCGLKLGSNPKGAEDSTVAATTAWVRDTIASVVPGIKVTNATLADRATQLATSRNIALTGDVTGSASFNGTANASIKATLANSGATAGAYGPTAAATLAFGGSVNIPQVTVDAKGRVTKGAHYAIKLPAAPTSVSGNAGSATKLATARTIGLTGAVTGTATSFDGTKNISISTTEIDGTKVSVFGKATSSAAGTVGAVPAPAANQHTRFLRGDGTWQVPTNTTYSNMVGATSSAAGKAGLVPAPSAGYNGRFLRGDGTWQTPTDNKMQQNASTTDGEYPLLAKSTTATANINGQAIFDADVTINPSTGTITANTFAGALSGNASTASSAAKLTTARTIRTNLASTSTASFNGTANVTPGVTGTLGTANGGTGRTDGKAVNVTQVVTLSAVGPLGYTSSNGQYLTTSAAIAYWNGRYSGSSSNLQYCKTGTIIGSNGGTITGNLTVNGTLSGATLSATSDIRLKNVLEQVKDVDLSSLSAYRYTFKNDESKTKHVGLIAQDVQKILPDAVITDKETGYLSIEYSALTAVLIDKINKLEKRIAELESK